MKNKISVLMTVYNASNFLRESINSILRQTYKNWELIIVDDCSSDSSLKVIKSFKNKKIKIHSLRKRIGRTNALNYGLKKTTGNLVAVLDADDVAHKKRFQIQENYLRMNRGTLLVGTWVKFIDAKGKFVKFDKTDIDEEKIYQNMAVKNIFNHSSIMFKKKIIKKIGNYPPKLIYSQDYGLILRLMKFSAPKIIPKYLTNIRRWNNSKKKKENQMTFNPNYKIFIVKEEIVNLKYTLKNFKLTNKSKFLWFLRFSKACIELILIKLFFFGRVVQR